MLLTNEPNDAAALAMLPTSPRAPSTPSGMARRSQTRPAKANRYPPTCFPKATPGATLPQASRVSDF